jgi:hypothetical protein
MEAVSRCKDIANYIMCGILHGRMMYRATHKLTKVMEASVEIVKSEQE